MAFLNSSSVQLECDPVGGRIVSLCVHGQEFLWKGPDMSAQQAMEVGVSDTLSEAGWRALKRRCGLRLLGGDRTWIAPEKEWWEKTPPLELDSGRYAEQVTSDMVVMTSPACRETGLRVVRSVRLMPDGVVHLREEIENVSDKPVARGIWNVSRIQRPFTVYFPGAIDQWRSYHLQDTTLPVPSVRLMGLTGKVGVPCISKECYKFGGMLSRGIAVLVKGDVVWEREFKVYPGWTYAHCSMVEVFNSHLYDYGEVEVHSPIHLLGPGQRAVFDQQWRFGKNGEFSFY